MLEIIIIAFRHGVTNRRMDVWTYPKCVKVILWIKILKNLHWGCTDLNSRLVLQLYTADVCGTAASHSGCRQSFANEIWVKAVAGRGGGRMKIGGLEQIIVKIFKIVEAAGVVTETFKILCINRFWWYFIWLLSTFLNLY